MEQGGEGRFAWVCCQKIQLYDSFTLDPLFNLQEESFRRKKITIAITPHPFFTFRCKNKDFPNMQHTREQQLNFHFVYTIAALLLFITAIQ